MLEDAGEADTEPVVEENAEVVKELAALKFPTSEGDTAPSAQIPSALTALQKYTTKNMASLVAQFTGSLTPMQSKILAWMKNSRTTSLT